MTHTQSARSTTVTLDTAPSRPWNRVAVAGAVTTIALESWDAFHISHPEGALIAIIAFVAGIAWLKRRGGRAPAIFLGTFFALELILNFTIFGVLGDLQHQGSWTDFSTGLGYTIAHLGGLIACLVLTAARPREAG
jgi:FtsH-binding integral membrane protein